ncbi:TIGR00730 family Rossman fold protein [Phenylobacterium immobile]|uniref:LOG family protein n=1 Tax=Phenylobacterium immobile TaxID=21 RepID=UPI000AC55978|nr:TIGR00730 family Rossman fold protein [Phenylobacterium immobile]
MHPDAPRSICVFCGSADAADPAFLRGAADLGRALADANLRLVYGGGGVGLMGACARAAHQAGGEVLGVIPDFLIGKERAYDEVETVVVSSMHERKQMMFEQSDGFVILPGGIGTLEEVVELLSWRRLDLHAKPVVFYNPRDFWKTLFALFQHTVDERLTPPDFMDAWKAVATVGEIVPALLAAPNLPAPPDAVVVEKG